MAREADRSNSVGHKICCGSVWAIEIEVHCEREFFTCAEFEMLLLARRDVSRTVVKESCVSFAGAGFGLIGVLPPAVWTDRFMANSYTGILSSIDSPDPADQSQELTYVDIDSFLKSF